MTQDDLGRSDVEPTEDSWVYVSGPLQVSDPEAARELYDRLADICEASGWHVYRPYVEPPYLGGREPPLSPRLRHAVGHADACVFYIGKPSSGVGTEMAWAAEHGRPVIAVQMRGDQPSPVLSSLLSEYDRAEVLLCEGPEDCAEKVRRTLADPDWHAVLRAAAADLAEDLQ